MSRVRADKLVDRAATGAVELTKGAWVLLVLVLPEMDR